MATKIQLRRDSETNWNNSDPVLAEGEVGVNLDTNGFKIGDGQTPWTGLPYAQDSNALGTYVSKVETASQNIVSDLTFDTDKIVLDAAGSLTVDNLILAKMLGTTERIFCGPVDGSDGNNALEVNNSADQVVAKIRGNGSANFEGDVSVGDSTTFSGTFADAVALLSEELRTTYAKAIKALPSSSKYDVSSYPSDTPTPLRDALERVTTAGKINLNSDGSATFANAVTIGDTDDTSSRLVVESPTFNVIKYIGGGDQATRIRFDSQVSAETNTPQGEIKVGNGGVAGYANQMVFEVGGNEVARYDADGSATFAGDVKIGKDLNEVTNIYLIKNGFCSFQRESVDSDSRPDSFSRVEFNREINNTRYALTIDNGNRDDPNFLITADGSADFAGDVTAVDAAFRRVSAANFSREYTLLYSSGFTNPEFGTFGQVKITSDYNHVSNLAGLKFYVASTPQNMEVALTLNSDKSAHFTGNVTSDGTIAFNLEPDDDSNYTTTTEEYEETIKVPIVNGVGTADLSEKYKEKTVTKTREIKTYTGPTLDVKEELLTLRERAAQQDAVIAQMTEALKKLGADLPPAAEAKSAKKK